MKRILAVVTVLAVLLSTVTVFASPSIDIDVSVDYENSVINIEYTTDAAYLSKVTAVIYSGSSDDISGYVRIYEGNAKDNETITFNFGEDIATGDYDVKVTLGGKNFASDTKKISIVNLNEAVELLAGINGASTEELKGKLEVAKDAIGLDFGGIYETNQSVVDAAFVSVRTNDFGGNITSLNDVRTAFDTARAVAETKLSVDSSMLKYNLGRHAGLLSIDIENKEYKQYADIVVDLVFASKNEINDAKSAKEIFEKNVAFAAVMNSKPSEGAEYLSIYAKQLKIEDYMTKYENSEKAKVARLIQESGITKAEDIPSALIDALDTVTQNEQNKPVYVPQGGGSGGGGGGSSFQGPAITPEPVIPSRKSFSDISDAEWAREYIETLATMGIINGYSDGTFRGNGTVTREEFVKMIVCAFEIQLKGADAKFSDVPSSDWAYEYINSAVASQIISGVSQSEFGYGKGVTREDMAVILFRLAKINGLEVDENLDIDPFKDHDNISDYAREGVYVMRKTGVINGFGNGDFRPKATLTRAEAAKVICEMLRVKY